MTAIGAHHSIAALLQVPFSALSLAEQCKIQPSICKARVKKLPLRVLKKLIIKRVIKKQATKIAKKIYKKKIERRTTCAKKQSLKFLVATLKKRELKRGVKHFKLGSIKVNAKDKAVKDVQKVMRATRKAVRNYVSPVDAKRIIKKIRTHAKKTVSIIMNRVKNLKNYNHHAKRIIKKATKVVKLAKKQNPQVLKKVKKAVKPKAVKKVIKQVIKKQQIKLKKAVKAQMAKKIKINKPKAAKKKHECKADIAKAVKKARADQYAKDMKMAHKHPKRAAKFQKLIKKIGVKKAVQQAKKELKKQKARHIAKKIAIIKKKLKFIKTQKRLKKSMAVRPKDKVIPALVQKEVKSKGSSAKCLKSLHMTAIPHTNVRKGSCWIGSPDPTDGFADSLDEAYVQNCMDTKKPDSKGNIAVGCRSMRISATRVCDHLKSCSITEFTQDFRKIHTGYHVQISSQINFTKIDEEIKNKSKNEAQVEKITIYVGDNAMKDFSVYSNMNTKLIQDICWSTISQKNCLFAGGNPEAIHKNDVIKKYTYNFETKTRNGGFLVLLNTLSVPHDWKLKDGSMVHGNALEAVQPYSIIQ